MQPKPTTGPDTRNLILAIVIATAAMFAWQHFYERPRAIAAKERAADQREIQRKVEVAKAHAPVIEKTVASTANSPRVKINSTALHGSIKLTGLRFDDLTLADYHETADRTSPEVKLLDGTSGADTYFAELGILAAGNTRVPDADTQWRANGTELSEQKPITLTWNNGAGLTFEKKIAVDDHYMFTVTTTVKNDGNSTETLYPYALVSRNYMEESKHFAVTHEGPLGVMNNVLDDVTYKSLREDGAKKYEKSKGWIGMTDKYWLTAVIPAEDMVFDSEFKEFKRDGQNAYQADLRGEAIELAPGKSTSYTMRLFAGAKVVDRLDLYGRELNIPLFDRAVDFGTLYIIAKPIFSLLNYFYGIVGNFGVAILILTVVLKLLLFPLASKSMTSMSRMKLLMPETQAIKEKHGNDKMKMNQEIMALYRREKVSPLGGCLPLLLQIPIFIALYRVLSVTIEMRQAPFFGWVKDLSVTDPSNIFTLLGYAPWNTPSFLHLGVWPIIYCVTMVLQQRLNPKPADPVQAAMMNYMPFFMTFIFMSFPAGLVIYYSWNNTLTIFQQLYINSRLTKKGLR